MGGRGGGGRAGDLWGHIQVAYISVCGVCVCKFLFSVDSSWWSTRGFLLIHT